MPLLEPVKDRINMCILLSYPSKHQPAKFPAIKQTNISKLSQIRPKLYLKKKSNMII
ncbi:hypothetical protein Hanom_Chr05g00387081 [Helianthus anomalus]